MISCRIALRRLEQRAEDELALEAALELDAHLARCERCAARARGLARLEELLGARHEPPQQSLDLEGAVARVLARVRMERGAARAESRPRRAAWLAAALLLIAVGLGARWVLRSESTAEPAGADAAAQMATLREEETIGGDEEPAGAGLATRVEPDAEELEALPPPQKPAAALLGPSLVLGRASEPDPVRLLAVHAYLRRGLIAAGHPALVAAPPAWRAELDARFERISAPLVREGWPVERIAAGWLASPDSVLAGAAARLVGPRADAVTLRLLEQALESGADPVAAARALVEAGAEGQRRLARRALHPTHGRLAREALLGLEPGIAATRLAQALRSPATRHEERAIAALAADLATLGTAGARALLELGDEGLLPAELALAALAETEGAPDAALAALEGRSPREFVALAAARLAGARALPGLLALTAQGAKASTQGAAHRHAEAIARALSWIDDPGALEHLARLAAERRLAPQTFGHHAVNAAQRHPQATERAAQSLARARAPEPAARLLEALAAEPSAASLPAIEALLGAPRMPREVALAAALALGDSGLEHAAEVLAAVLEACTRSERHLAAACLAGIAKLRGEESAELALRSRTPRASPSTTRDVLAALQRRGTDRDASLLRLARALEPALPPDDPYRRSEP